MILQSTTGTVLRLKRSGIGCLTAAVVYVKRVAVSWPQNRSASGDRHDGLRQAIAPGKPELTIQAKGTDLTSCYAIGP